jgi:phosphate transport system protein
MTERRVLSQDENQIRSELQKLSDLVQTAIENISNALCNLDISLCEEIIANDQIINNLHLKIEQDCFTTVATQQPVAVDLRILTAGLHISIELERIADYVAGIAGTIIKIAKEVAVDNVNEVAEMLTKCKQMLQQAVQAYMSNDSELALTVAKKDAEIDDMQTQLSSETIKKMCKNPGLVPFGSRLLWIIHSIERIGDRATNICEQIVYIHQGVVPNLND